MSEVIFSKASGVNDSFFGKSQEPIKAFLEKHVEEFEKNSMLKKIFVTEKSKNFAEKFTYKTKLGNFMDVGENGTYPRSIVQEGYAKVLEPHEWKNQFAVTQTMLEDSQLFDLRGEMLGFSDGYNRTKELFGAALLSGATAAKVNFAGKEYDTTSADGAALFSAAHTSVTGGYGNQSNLFKGEFSYDTLCAMEEAMQDFRDDDGNLVNVCPDTIIIPNDHKLRKAVFDAIGAEGMPGTANNSFNYQYGRWNVIIWPYLSKMEGGAQVYMMDSRFNENYRGLIWLDRLPLSVHSWVDENTDANIFNGRARFTAGFNNWRAIACLAPGMSGGTALGV